MSLTRKSLVAMGIEDEKIEQIISMHTETVNALKDERDSAKEEAEKFKADSAKLEKAEKELEKLKTKSNEPNEFEQKYADLKKEYDDYKAEQTAKAVKDQKESLYRKLLKEAGVSDKRMDAVIRLTDFDKIELDGDAIKDVDAHKENIVKEWSDYIVTEGSAGAKTSTPPANDGKGGEAPLSSAAQRAIQYHNNLYGANNTK